MGDFNTIKSYLVRLGFATDDVSFSRFSGILRDAASLVDSKAFSIGHSLFKWQAAITGGFSAVGTATLGIADKVAMADQQYRLLGLHMFTNTQTARELKVAMDALGEPLENIAWDPELAKRFNQLVQDQRTMTAELGSGFEADMYKLRDFRFEVTRFEVELKYLAMMVVDDLTRAFGMSGDTLLDRMRNFNTWFITHMPEVSRWITAQLKPVLIDVKNIMGETWNLVKLTGAAFANVVGAISQDKHLQGTALSFDKISRAIGICIGWMNTFVMGMLHAEEIITHLVSAASFLATGDFKDALSELKSAAGITSIGSGGLSGAMMGGAVGMVLGGPAGALLGSGVGAVGGMMAGAGFHPTADQMKTEQSIVAAANAMGVSPQLALAVAKYESGFNQYDKFGRVLMSNVTGSHAAGIFQLEPKTARLMGVNADNPMMNIIGGVKYLKELLEQYHGNVAMALEHYYGSTNASKNAQYARQVMQIESGVKINSLTITIGGTNLNHSQIASAARKGIEQASQRQIQRNIAQFQASITASY